MSISVLSGRGWTYLVAACGLLAPLLGAMASVTPSPWSWCCAAGAVLAAGVAGMVSKVPAFLVGRPLVSAGLVVPLLTLSGVLVEQAFASPEGMGRAALLAVAVLCSGLAGKPLPSPAPSPKPSVDLEKQD